MKDYIQEDKFIKAQKRVDKIKGFYSHLIVYLAVNFALGFVVIKNVSFNELELPMFSTAFFWGIGLAFHAYGVFGKHLLFSKEWEARKLKEIMDKDTFE